MAWEDSGMRKTLAWLRRHPFAVFAMLTVDAGAAAWLYVQTPSHLGAL